MKIIMGNEKDSFWKSIPTILIRDERLSFQARAVAIFLLCMSSKWEFRAQSLPFLLKCRDGHLGRDATRKILKELETCGYLDRTKFRNPDGKWIWSTIFSPMAASSKSNVFDEPETIGACSGGGVAVDDRPVDKSMNKESEIKKELLPPPTDSNVVVVEHQDPGSNSAGCYSNLDLSHPLLTHFHVIIEQTWKKFETKISTEQMQQIIDEFTGVLSASGQGLHPNIQSKRGWLRAVVKAMLDGEFVPEYGVPIRKNRLQLLKSKLDIKSKCIKEESLEAELSMEKRKMQLQKIKTILSKKGQ